MFRVDKIMFKNKILAISLLAGTLVIAMFPLLLHAQASAPKEEITLVTYYPAPIGIYSELRSRRMAVGNTYFDPAQHCFNAGGGCGAIPTISTGTDLVVEDNVGIGTTNPSAVLDIARNMTAGVNTLNIQNGPNEEIHFSGTNYATNVYSDRAFALGTSNTHDLTLRTNSLNRVRISKGDNGATAIGTGFINGLTNGIYDFPNSGGLLVDGLISIDYASMGYPATAKLIVNNGAILVTSKSNAPGSHSGALMSFGDLPGSSYIVFRRTATGNNFAIDT